MDLLINENNLLKQNLKQTEGKLKQTEEKLKQTEKEKENDKLESFLASKNNETSAVDLYFIKNILIHLNSLKFT